ncbi:hypothetical protein ACJ6WF_19315 [Streptomyces sp. MMS24-I2-30]|uniref:hypothetical protein n=1 Tax=Streptomyces sp. MMS24-I2-30 TaxID=3351564 RepID=UPI003896B483
MFTDVIRTALSLDTGPDADWRRLVPAALRLRRILADAAAPLGLVSVPGTLRIAAALMRWCQGYGTLAPEASL